MHGGASSLLRLTRADEVSISESREPRLRILLENSPDVIAVMDLDAHLLYLNRTVPPYRRDEMLGLSTLHFMPEDHRDKFMFAFNAVIATGEPQQLEVETHHGYAWRARLVALRENERTRSSA